ncbi:hypothetical protein RNAN_3464 [Rheinheimera nanhaiensis E407-8]|uniref:Uncharacterized protein n=1 Tax=Rheinheimera nanhaiensis E407-8 TaxID=562729 RepID=I1E2B2_9GAMM|nr:hypothetical protein RNAN_3464 [Rheinheimera nanhaiensis E407-8]
MAVLLHAMLLAALLNAKIPARVTPPLSEAVVSYLYQPPPTKLAQQPEDETTTGPTVMPPKPVNIAPSVTAAPQQATNEPAVATAALPDKAAQPEPQDTVQTLVLPQQSLAQRALNQAAAVAPAAIEQAATASYQQLRQAQQQPKITVEKRHQPLSQDPAGQVVAQLNDGRQLIRVKGGCRIADPGKDGFDALMAANAVVPCGDEEDSSALLKQALEKHLKR